MAPSFLPRVVGTLITALSLAGCGGGGSGSGSTQNTAPVAALKITSPYAQDPVSLMPEVPVGTPVVLSAGDSHDPQNDAIAFNWSLKDSPVTILATDDASTTTFTPTTPGAYTLRLQVEDVKGLVDTKEVTINAYGAACTASCISGQFVDEPVDGLRYECAYIRARTLGGGQFSCPANSTVTFYLQKDNGTRRLTLGSTRVRAIAGQPLQLFMVTPASLVPGGELLTDLSGGDDTTTRILNIGRILQTLAKPSRSLPAPLALLTLQSAEENLMEKLPRNLSPSDLGADFDSLFQPVAVALGSALASRDSTRAILEMNGLNQVTGIYEASLPFGINTPAGTLYTGMTAQKNNEARVEQFLLMLDRDGKALGFGLEWGGTIVNPPVKPGDITSLSQLPRSTTPISELSPESENVGFAANGAIRNGLAFRTYAPGSDHSSPSGRIRVTQGKLQSSNLIGHPEFYRNLFGLPVTDPLTEFTPALWERTDNLGTQQFSGSISIARTRALAAWLDPKLWKTEQSIGTNDAERRPVFPLHLEVTLNNTNTSLCPVTGCETGKLAFTVLPNGNIVTDLDKGCQAVDSSLMDTGGQQEYRIGAISSVATVDGRILAGTVLLVPRIPGLETLYGTVLGLVTGAGGSPAVLDITNALKGQVSLMKQENPMANAQAEWVNYLSVLKAMPLTDGRESAMRNAIGAVSGIRVESCYHPTAIP